MGSSVLTATTFASLPSYNSLGDVATWVANTKMRRPDLYVDILDLAADVYNTVCGRIPFEALQFTSPEIATAVGVPQYDITTSLTPNVLAGIASIRITFVTGQQSRRLFKSHVRVYDSLSFISNNRPATYARWGNTIEMNPPPDSAQYTFRIRYWAYPVIGIGNDKQATALVTPLEWYELLKWETLYRAYWLDEQVEKAQALISPPGYGQRVPAGKKLYSNETGILPRLWNDLLQTMAQRETVDDDYSVNPYYRSFTHMGGGR
jgi:hypothetical protein